MRIFLLFLAFICIAMIFIVTLKGTIFEFSLKRRKFGGLLIARELFLFVILGAFIFEIFDPNRFNIFFITKKSVMETTPAVFISVALLFIFIGFFSKTIFKKYLLLDRKAGVFHLKSDLNIACIIDSLVLFLIILIFVVHAFGGKHAFISSFLGGANLLQVRLANVYENNGPRFIMGYLRFSTILLAIFIGFFGQKISRKKQYFCIALIAYAATFPGDKAPLISVFILFYISRLSVVSYAFKKLAIIAIGAFLTTSGLVYFLTKIQFPEKPFDEIIIYLVGRLGVGQIQGVYEQFALRLKDFSYIISEIPLSGVFGNRDPFSKDLMMLTGAFGMNREDIGVMSSFFIGEALAIGGMSLLYLSPIFVAFNFCLLAFLVIKIITIKFQISSWYSKRIGALFTSSIAPFTGDFGGLLMFKKIIVVMVFMIIIFSIFKLLKKFRSSRYFHQKNFLNRV